MHQWHLSDKWVWFWWRGWGIRGGGDGGIETGASLPVEVKARLIGVCDVRCRGSSLIAIVPAHLGLDFHLHTDSERQSEIKNERNRESSRQFIPLSHLSHIPITHSQQQEFKHHDYVQGREDKSRRYEFLTHTHTHAVRLTDVFHHSTLIIPLSPFMNVLKWLLWTLFLKVTVTHVDCMQMFLLEESNWFQNVLLMKDY